MHQHNIIKHNVARNRVFHRNIMTAAVGTMSASSVLRGWGRAKSHVWMRSTSSSATQRSCWNPDSKKVDGFLWTTKRTFFASSTDHTTLLQNAKLHRMTNANNTSGLTEYVLAPNDADLDLIRKVPQLKLAQLFVQEQDHDKNHLLFGAKVVQRTLGSTKTVCSPLVDAALQDIAAANKGTNTYALARLDGLCEWVTKGLEFSGEKEDQKNGMASVVVLLGELSDHERMAVQAMATGIPRPGHSVVGVGTYRDGKEAWARLATAFLEESLEEDEAGLYQSKGGTMVGIDHLANDSRDYLQTAGGAMARFSF
eukprot:scaffold379947_cov43-Attheya_sp.AAC.1